MSESEEDAAGTTSWLWRGFLEHATAANNEPEIAASLTHIETGLHLLAYIIDNAADSMNSGQLTSNELAAIACFTRSFRAIRATTMLAVSGLVPESRVYVRDIYESASMARFLAREPKKADVWLSETRWIKDNEVRQYVQQATTPGIPVKDSPYSEFYRQSSEVHHPTARGCLPLVLNAPYEEIVPQLASEYSSEHARDMLRQIALETVFVCFTVINALADPAVIPPDWHMAVKKLAEDVAKEADWSHLERDWDEERRKHESLLSQVVGADELNAHLSAHPNSVDNLRRRSEQASNADPDTDVPPPTS